jgi:tRNA(Ile2) C34 agmatinyltransferase TiaS
MKALLRCPKCGALVYADNKEFQCKLCGITFSRDNEIKVQRENLTPLEKQYHVWTLLMDLRINRINDEELE